MFKTKETDRTADDFQQTVTRKIDTFGDRNDFPDMAKYNITRETLFSYLFDKQVILDSAGSEKFQYTLALMLVFLPIIALSLYPQDKMPWGENTIFVGIGIGLMLFGIYRLIMWIYIKGKLKKHNDANIENYINEVINY